jgi:hypothetical protein
MAHTNADKRRVFLAFRSVFVGERAQLRKSKKISELIQKHSASFGPLFKDFRAAKINEIVKVLLEARIFESELKAKIAFPELFQISPAREEQRAASQDEVARSEAGALEDIASVGDVEEVDDNSGSEGVITGMLW